MPWLAFTSRSSRCGSAGCSSTWLTAGTVDAAAEALSVGVVDPGDLMVMYGTTMFFILVTDRPIPDPRMWATGYVLPGKDTERALI